MLKVGNKYNYYETKTSLPISCTLLRIFNDGHYDIYEFKYDNRLGYGSTIYPSKLHDCRIEDRQNKLSKI